ncbi:acyl-CoA-binding domain-containing protein 6 isoform X3 [Nyctibius grandis]|uniref:acyl-CoA-binding domain-containing protein 6 isoform X3 n=1 Tax=Nyctibius grandis TaxID=48427 RepID=UPI0035BC335A
MASPPLPAAAAGSGGEASSGSEETGTAASVRDLAELFEQAAERLPALLPAASKEQLLYLYARYKQVKFGTCNTPKPSFFDFEGKQKWEAWKALGDTSPHQAMQEYVATVKKMDPSWNPQTTEKRGKESKTAFGGPVVSSLYQEETIRVGLCSTGRATEDTRSWFRCCYSTLLTLTARTGKARLHSITSILVMLKRVCLSLSADLSARTLTGWHNSTVWAFPLPGRCSPLRH